MTNRDTGVNAPTEGAESEAQKSERVKAFEKSVAKAKEKKMKGNLSSFENWSAKEKQAREVLETKKVDLARRIGMEEQMSSDLSTMEDTLTDDVKEDPDVIRSIEDVKKELVLIRSAVDQFQIQLASAEASHLAVLEERPLTPKQVEEMKSYLQAGYENGQKGFQAEIEAAQASIEEQEKNMAEAVEDSGVLEKVASVQEALDKLGLEINKGARLFGDSFANLSEEEQSFEFLHRAQQVLKAKDDNLRVLRRQRESFVESGKNQWNLGGTTTPFNWDAGINVLGGGGLVDIISRAYPDRGNDHTQIMDEVIDRVDRKRKSHKSKKPGFFSFKGDEKRRWAWDNRRLDTVSGDLEKLKKILDEVFNPENKNGEGLDPTEKGIFEKLRGALNQYDAAKVKLDEVEADMNLVARAKSEIIEVTSSKAADQAKWLTAGKLISEARANIAKLEQQMEEQKKGHEQYMGAIGEPGEEESE